MSTYILLPKKRVGEMLGLNKLSVSEARSRLISAAFDFGSPATSLLAGLGLKERVPEERYLEATRHYTRLPNLRALVASFESDAHAKEATLTLGDSYDFIPNARLQLPRPVELVTRLELDSTWKGWPEDTGIPDAHKKGNKGQGALVGVLDTGCDADHAEHTAHEVEYCYVPLSPANDSLRTVRGFDTQGHGTHVSGIINGADVGIAPSAQLMVASVIESETVHTSLERIVVGLDWLARIFAENKDRPGIVSMSLGFLDSWLTPPDLTLVRKGIRGIFQFFIDDLRILPIVAIGNDGPGNVRAPAYFPEIFAVGAVDFHRQPADFSGGGISPVDGVTKPNIAGYGVAVFSSFERNILGQSLYARLSGTSMATPYVAGIAALVASANPSLSAANLRDRLMATALPIPHPRDRVGAGLARVV
jgi:subtilisin family serine protease